MEITTISLQFAKRNPRINFKTPLGRPANPDLAGDAFTTIAGRVLVVDEQGDKGLLPEVEGGGEGDKQIRRSLQKPKKQSRLPRSKLDWIL
jgi:hypothetical protein